MKAEKTAQVPRTLRLMMAILFLGCLAALFSCIYLAGTTNTGWIKALAIYGATVATLLAAQSGQQAIHQYHPILIAVLKSRKDDS